MICCDMMNILIAQVPYYESRGHRGIRVIQNIYAVKVATKWFYRLKCNFQFSFVFFSYYWYWRHGNWGKVSDDDTICQRLWGVDYNRLQQQNDYDIFLQSRILKNSSVDRSRRRLFRQVNMDKLLLKPTYKTFIGMKCAWSFHFNVFRSC